MRKLLLLFATLTVLMISCERQPPLHLYDSAEADFNLPLIDLQLDVYWNYDLNYELSYDVKYDWRSEWYFGWDDNDRAVFGELGYTEPDEFNLRRYYTGDIPNGPRLSVRQDKVYGKTFSGR